MENLDEYNQDNEFLNNEVLSPTAKENLHNSAIWVKVVAIVGIVFTGIGALFTLFLIFTEPLVAIINLAFYALIIYVATLLLNISKNIERGNFNMEKFAENFLKYWKIVAILTIISIALGVIGMIFMVSSGFMLMNNF